MSDIMDVPDHLQGPWAAYLIDEDGFAYGSLNEVQAAGFDDGLRFQVVIARRTGMPKQVSWARAGSIRWLRLPGFIVSGDIICLDDSDDGLPLQGDDRFLGAAAWMDRALAAAAGLNLAGRLQ